ncbi:hypothetical protein AB3N59_02780 [Leptospira sp. WS92.C1]
MIILYWIAPNLLPGPVDDSAVTLGVGIYQIYRYFKERNSLEKKETDFQSRKTSTEKADRD